MTVYTTTPPSIIALPHLLPHCPSHQQFEVYKQEPVISVPQRYPMGIQQRLELCFKVISKSGAAAFP